jgi:hypothetical protein
LELALGAGPWSWRLLASGWCLGLGLGANAWS